MVTQTQNVTPTETRSETDLAADAATRWLRPAVDLVETDAGYRLLLDLPGVPKDQLDVALEERTLTIRGRRTPTLGYRWSLALPETLNAERIEARLEDGVLTIELSRVPKPEPRRIPIA